MTATYTQPSPVAESADGEMTGTLSFADHQHGMPDALPEYAPTVVALTYAATIAVNAEAGNDFRVTLTGNATLGNPANPDDGQEFTFHVTQDATGSRTLAYGTAWDWGTAGAPTLTTTASKTDVIKAVYNATLSKMLGLSCTKGF